MEAISGKVSSSTDGSASVGGAIIGPQRQPQPQLECFGYAFASSRRPVRTYAIVPRMPRVSPTYSIALQTQLSETIAKKIEAMIGVTASRPSQLIWSSP